MSGNLKEVRDRIKSVKNTQQITRVMKMVSASKMRRAQQAITRMRPYAEKQNEMLRNILSNLDGDVNISFGVERPVEKVCIVVLTSNRGLCGAFNSSMYKKATALLEEYKEVHKAGNLTMLFIGKKARDYFAKRYKDITLIDEDLDIIEKGITFEKAQKVAKYLMDSFENGTYDKIDVVYNRFKNPVVQFPSTEQFLPVQKLETEGDTVKADYIFEPNKEDLLNQLVPSILQTQFFKYTLDSNASEHGARMTAMDNATENAEELIRELKINYNKARQEAITTELTEIVSGAAALETE